MLPAFKDSKQNIESKDSKTYTFLSSFLYVLKILNPKNIESFLDSKDFKEKYIDKNHPFPPLTNPDSINYEKLPPKIAWCLNIPLPNNYEFIFLTNGASASDVTIFWMKKSNINTTECWMQDIDKYIASYELLLSHKGEYNALNFTEKTRKTMFLINKPARLYYIVRDPISRYRVGVNHLRLELIQNLRAENPLSNRFNLTCDYKNIFVDFIYWFNTKTPQLSTLTNKYVEAINTYIVFSSVFNRLKNLGLVDDIYVADFNDFLPQSAYRTFCRVGEHFGFKACEDLQYYIDKKWGDVAPYMPVTLHANSYDIPNLFLQGKAGRQGLESLGLNEWNLKPLDSINKTIREAENLDIHIGLYDDFKNTPNVIDITSEFFSQKIIIDRTSLYIYISKNDIKILKNNEKLYEACGIYLRGYIQALESRIKEIQKNIIREPQILEYLESNETLRAEIKNLFDKELAYFKKNYPHIVDTWQYYKEFEKMCGEKY
ncbi:DUF2972 domain-containing protein [Helicobacter saguini]|uniref:DUF2972 domain-containing protein n=1 Tax=Helicobacter saguini TaxID=1548018 RepID=A0A347W5J3_9HELI|nr:DUF2972 domain-containing protein [Helicobacter saguini]MWV67910.1 DUF2972 domain-containing protein [Helicobacter saguini]MWV70622.1 DUF2972 domain-containing protein [Helicobacter saguini]MWV72526.1 DUF2972 domain-containing protein [Helicobacter saguini]TLD94732.1 DUF2972 domain-containing protein [Helicobacter saguini]